MDVRNLKYVLEVANLHNITKAAEKLHLTQPTLSKMVKSLEDELGVILFDRSGKYVRLTDAGTAAMEQIRLIIAAVDNLHMTLDDISNLKTGTIKIGLPPVISSVFVPKVVTPFQKNIPTSPSSSLNRARRMLRIWCWRAALIWAPSCFPSGRAASESSLLSVRIWQLLSISHIRWRHLKRLR